MHSFHRSSRSQPTSSRPGRAVVVDLVGDLIAVATAIAAAVAASRALGDGPATPDDVVVHLAGLSALVVGVWWVVNVVAWSAAIRRGHQLARFTLPGTKRVAQLVLAVSLSTTACSVGADDSPTMQLVAAADATSTAPPTTAPPTTAPPTTAPPTTAPPTTAPGTTADLEPSLPPSTQATGERERTEPTDMQPTDTEPTDTADPAPLDVAAASGSIPEHRIVVAAGDNLWVLAEQALIHHGTTDPTVGQVASYWRQVVAANDVRSSNPDLIVPGETIAMPAFVLSTTDR